MASTAVRRSSCGDPRDGPLVGESDDKAATREEQRCQLADADGPALMAA